MRWVVAIQAYNRQDYLDDLMEDVGRAWDEYTLDDEDMLYVLVMDDGSEPPLTAPAAQLVYSTDRNFGRAGFGEWTTLLYEKLARFADTAHFFVLLPDDIRLCRNFFYEAQRHWRSCPADAVALSLGVDAAARDGNWGSGSPEVVNDMVSRSGWVDGGVLVTRTYFDRLSWRVPAHTPNTDNDARGSGVGAALSRGLRRHHPDHGMYMTHKSLFRWRDVESRMNRSIRVEQPSRTVNFIDEEDPCD